MIFNYINWSVSPELISFDSINYGIRYYSLFFALSFIMGYIITQKSFKKEGIAIEELDRLTTYVFLGAIIGARLGHCLFYQPDYYLLNPIKILYVWEGGLASHGGTLGIIFAIWIYAKKIPKLGMLWALDKVAVPTALAGFFIRMGNLMNSEIYGHETSLPWGFVFQNDGQTVPKHPTQIYEAICYLIVFVFMYFLSKKDEIVNKRGYLLGVFFIGIFTVRFFVEFVKENQVNFESSMFLNMGQLLSIPFILTGIYLVFFKASK